ncbi:DUF4129 domain-containing protein [Alicyclobacillus curvatus]|nr:DUF4129 domain-containing protein [Alicyclobacillus curvatus]
MSNRDANGGAGGAAYLRLPRVLYWLVVLLTLPVPYVLYTSLLDSGETVPSGWLLPFLFLLVTLWILGLLMRHTSSPGILFTLAVLCIAAAEGVWHLLLPHQADVWVYPLLTLVVSYRLSRWLSAGSLSEENRTSFMLEGILAAVATLLMLVTGTPGEIRGWLVFILFISLALRLVAMWRVERLETQSEGAKGNFGLLLILLVLAVWVGPKVLYWVLLVLVGGGAVVSLPFLYMLNAIFPKRLVERSLASHNALTQLLNHAKKPTHVVAQNHSLAWVLYLLYGLFFLGAIWMVWRMSRRRLAVEEHADGSAAVTVHRQRMAVQKATYLSTSDATRQRYQEFLRHQEQDGVPIGLSETPREYRARIDDEEISQQPGAAGTRAGAGGAGGAPARSSGDAIAELTQAYENTRYGRPAEDDTEREARDH